ncbi:undecaprenyl-diphosphatase [Dyadobacter koreensis]|uniref:Undecaprenyl-diphosphatase n=1 Tax=Dyadobacter koreensis TaxID=408657 RepID=A0A1H6Y832_9BACT|nr:phosphatase PAP2 family protein [Dyadobacter koreensis]SEJ32925.1 undecaprenyl-diphosphatase [Dyadobacter koreensis]
MTTAIDIVIHGDQDLFLWLNGKHTPWIDTIMCWGTFKFTWIPMYIVLLFLTVRAEKFRSIAIIATVLAAVILADKVTSGLMKPYFMRFRPCHEPLLSGLVHNVGGCGGLYGFASAHAATSFSLAIVWFQLTKNKINNMGWLFAWAAFYSYSRVYVGVHYPGDILVGALVGLIVGWICVQLYLIFLKKYYPN